MTNLSIQPSKLEIQVKPGTNYVQSYLVKNNGDQPVTLYTSLDSWQPTGSEGDIVYQNSLPDFGLSLSNSNLKLGQTFVLNPNQSQQLILKIQVPLDAPSGDRYFTFFINQDLSPFLSTNSTQLIRIGSHLLMSVSNSEQSVTNFKINHFKINSPFVDCFFSNIKFSGEIENNSDFFDKIDNKITISKSNIDVKNIVIFPDNILAHHSRSIRCLDDKSPIDCQLNKPLWPGIYHATLINQTTTFIVLPYSLLTLLIITSVIVKLIIDMNKRRNLYLNK